MNLYHLLPYVSYLGKDSGYKTTGISGVSLLRELFQGMGLRVVTLGAIGVDT